jgi:hypothetical protein
MSASAIWQYRPTKKRTLWGTGSHMVPKTGVSQDRQDGTMIGIAVLPNSCPKNSSGDDLYSLIDCSELKGK